MYAADADRDTHTRVRPGQTEQLMWGDVVVSNMDQAALLATQIRRASLALPSYEKAEVVGDEMLQGEAGQEVSVSMVKAEVKVPPGLGQPLHHQFRNQKEPRQELKRPPTLHVFFFKAFLNAEHPGPRRLCICKPSRGAKWQGCGSIP